MVNRAVVHFKNFYYALTWMLLNYNDLRKQLESQGYYSIQIYKIFLWKDNAKYFKVFNIEGKCFFVKLQSKDKVKHEYDVIQYIDSRNVDKLDFYPRITYSSIGLFSYNIFEELDGVGLDKNLILNSNLINQMLDIITFFNNIKIVHRDIRPHNIIVIGNKIKVVDFEHCSINNQRVDDSPEELNENFSPRGRKWDDAYSFKKIADYYIGRDKLKDNIEYNKLSSMIDKNTYECS